MDFLPLVGVFVFAMAIGVLIEGYDDNGPLAYMTAWLIVVSFIVLALLA